MNKVFYDVDAGDGHYVFIDANGAKIDRWLRTINIETGEATYYLRDENGNAVMTHDFDKRSKIAVRSKTFKAPIKVLSPMQFKQLSDEWINAIDVPEAQRSQPIRDSIFGSKGA